MNGGETGYTNIRDIEQHKNDIRGELEKSNGKIPIKKAWDFLGERFDEMNRAVENCARFAAFMTSREMGMSIDRSIYDAKEASMPRRYISSITHPNTSVTRFSSYTVNTWG